MPNQLEINLLKIQSHLDLDNQQVRAILKHNEFDRPDYVELQYVQFSGNQRINTGINAGYDITFQTKLRMETNTGGSIIGVRTEQNGEQKNFRFFNYDNKFYLDYGSGEGYNRISGGTWSLNSTYDLEVGNRYVKNLSSRKTEISGEYVSNFTFTNAPIYLFGDGTAQGRIYYFKLLKGGSIVRYLIPVRRTKDNLICMFDLISQQFFLNEGSGTLGAGGVV